MHAIEDGAGDAALSSSTYIFSFAQIDDRQDMDPKAASLPWDAFCSEFSKPDITRSTLTLTEYQGLDGRNPEEKKARDAQKDGPAWLPAIFKPDGKRVNNDVLWVTAFVGDCDDGEITAEQIQERLLGIEYFLHTTYSHTPEKSKWHVIVPFHKPIAPKQLAAVFDHFDSRLGGHLDPVGKKPAQLYYKPSCPRDAEHLFQSYRGIGQLFDPETVLKHTAQSSAQPPAGQTVERFGRNTTMPRPCRDGERNQVAVSAIGRWFGQGFSHAQVLSLAQEWNAANIDRWLDEKVRSIVDSMLRTDQHNHPERYLADPWEGVEVPAGYQLSGAGVYHLSDKPEKPDLRISGPVWMSASARDYQSKGWGKLIEWVDSERRHHQASIPAERFHEQGNMLAQELARDGLVIVPGREKHLAAYLGSFQPQRYLRSVTRLGWLDDIEGNLVFVLPEHTFGSIIEEKPVFQPERHSPTASTIRGQATVQQWQQEVAAQTRGNPFLVFGICLGFAGPLMKPLSIESGGFHFYGRSSHGKTTLAQVAASVWGCGADPASDPVLAYVQRWNTTQNGLEGLASAHNDGLVVLDEIGTCTAKDFGQVIYGLAGGRGKVAMNADRHLKPTRHWRLLFLSTGEISAQQKMEEESHTPKAGQLLRMLDIPILSGVVEDCHGLAPAEYVNRLKAACSTAYGTAGPAFLQVLVTAFADFHALQGHLTPRMQRALGELAVPGLEPEQARALRRLALVLVAGELAIDWQILPLTRAEVLEALRVVRDAWLRDLDLLSDAERGIECVRAFILKHKSRFQEISHDANEDAEQPDLPEDYGVPIRDRAGYVDRRRKLYLLYPEALKEAVRGHDVKAVLRALAKRELLFTNDSHRFISKHHIRGEAKRLAAYAVKFTVLEGDQQK